MPFEIDLGGPRVGYALQDAREGEEVPVCFRDFSSSEDGQAFIQFLESFTHDVLSRLPVEINPSQIDHMLVLYHSSGKAEVFLNELDLKIQTRVKGAVQAGARVMKSDIADIEGLDLGVEVADDVGYLFVFSIGWRKGLFFDYGPIVPIDPQPRQYSVNAALGRAYCHVLFQERFNISDDEWQSLSAAQWFPFVSLSDETNGILIGHVRAGWDPDEKLDDIYSEVRERIPQMLESWRSHSSFQPDFGVLERAIEHFQGEDFLSCSGLLFPLIKGILRTHYASRDNAVPPNSDDLAESAVAAKIKNDKSLLFPHRFASYLRDVYFVDFDPSNLDSVDPSQEIAECEPRSKKKSALISILVVQQLFYFLDSDRKQRVQVAQSERTEESEAGSIDPVHSLAFSINSNPGAYALLIGSGVSSEAGILTGWDITEDLIRQLAHIRQENCEPDPGRWYVERYNQRLDYSSILEAFGKTSAERQKLLLRYFEPNAEDREEGKKLPTQAHRAIAQLVAHGLVKVIITTNFDRLLETAIREAGIDPIVLSTEDQVTSAIPLVHIPCCVFKVNGDYQDHRIRNITGELDSYPNPNNELLGQIFEQFGLIVCGWSAEYDGGLRIAMSDTRSPHFTTYWAQFGELTDQARQLIRQRDAQVIRIEGAGDFFHSLKQSAESIEQFRPTRTISTGVSLASMKRFLTEPGTQIELTELIDDTISYIKANIESEDFEFKNLPEPNSELVTERIRAYEGICASLMEMAVVGGRYAQEENFGLWQRALKRLSLMPFVGGVDYLWLNMRLYPCTLLLYALGLGAVEADRLSFLGHLFSTRVQQQFSKDQYAVELIAPALLFRTETEMQVLEGMEDRLVPLNDWLFRTLREFTKDFISDEYHFTYTFVKFEILLALHASFYGKDSWSWEIPIGTFRYKLDAASQVIKELEGSISRLNDTSQFVVSGIFGESADNCIQAVEDLKKWLFEYFSPRDKRYWEHLF